MPIDLALPRTFVLEDRGRTYSMTTRQITEAMWRRYFSGIVSTQETDGKGNTITEYESASARLDLLESALIDATGYTSAGAPDITAIEGWQTKLPMSHRRAVSDLLASAEQDMPNETDSFELGFELVVLKSTWTASSNGRMQEISGLKHYLRSPSADHQKRYSRASSRSVVVGGSRTGQTRWYGAQDVLIEIYDELIVKVEGYVSDGKPIEGGAITKEMDAYHKVAVASTLFTPVQVS